MAGSIPTSMPFFRMVDGRRTKAVSLSRVSVLCSASALGHPPAKCDRISRNIFDRVFGLLSAAKYRFRVAPDKGG